MSLVLLGSYFRSNDQGHTKLKHKIGAVESSNVAGISVVRESCGAIFI